MKVHTERVASGGGNWIKSSAVGVCGCRRVPIMYPLGVEAMSEVWQQFGIDSRPPVPPSMAKLLKMWSNLVIKDYCWFWDFWDNFTTNGGVEDWKSTPDCCQTPDMISTPHSNNLGPVGGLQTHPALIFPLPRHLSIFFKIPHFPWYRSRPNFWQWAEIRFRRAELRFPRSETRFRKSELRP